MLTYLTLAVMTGVGLQYFLLWYLIGYHFKKHESNLHALPVVNVLLPCRNEAHTLPDCLQAFEDLRYPVDKIRFYVADDHSEDQTAAILSRWTAAGENRHLVSLPHPPGKQENGKAVALAAMIDRAGEGLLLFTDADCIVPAGWAETMSKAYRSEFGLLTGITTISGNGFFQRMQSLDWWLVLGKVKVVSDLGFSLTAMGNNMMADRDAYHRSGGFAAVRDQVTEDLALSINMYRQGYRPAHLVNKDVLVKTRPQKSFGSLLEQRKRWARGAFSLPWYWQMLLGLQVVFYLALVVGLIQSFWLAAGIWGLKICFQSMFMSTFARKTETKIGLIPLLGFEIYNWLISWSTVLYYFWPSGIKWKNRKYR
ncbi:Glycosyltransferase, catalytic subunit of cellulose synthase and poly-beta-1,6-N-acetylglucosamine synthase [Cyclobacterium lianum]|uniref:Glycosyltransferase, catalytic subunit of cellulose synthase and poly-beta-1,6-N-acetylglucosamine synthase n=1 Tax=Cyclobacterium lianum TaxID=388280 RepID=A0A1M7P8P0_9BACT|nr:glycosyltransferase family 2 protein [Cyclobacterium lianum]SHN13045.1 Glycosyltransferase, catalytic subunit of cellulose synthase and poly-beta-1,6-N-acetylglucosamine synthase [Cyclobacterium lianum]